MTRRSLTPDESELWERVRQTARPLHPERKHPPESAPRPAPKSTQAQTVIPRFAIGDAAPAGAESRDLIPTPREALASAPVQMDRRNFERMKRGKLSPEARLDLHGKTMAEAQPALRDFIFRAHGDGKRLVLVITGKGKHRDDGGPIPVPYGVLKHQVPQWLAMAPLRAMVLQVSEAHLKHGGGGAYYIYLRRGR